MANVLLGRDKNFDGGHFAHGCFKVYGLQSNKTSVTKKTCHDSGPFLGKTSFGSITVVDTPGFGNNLQEEEKTIESLVNVLKNEIRYTSKTDSFLPWSRFNFYKSLFWIWPLPTTRENQIRKMRKNTDPKFRVFDQIFVSCMYSAEKILA